LRQFGVAAIVLEFRPSLMSSSESVAAALDGGRLSR
jgi:hypothetical protein